MRIAITTPTGHIGSVVADQLVESGHKVTLLARNAAKVQHLVERGAQVAEGSLSDRGFVREATAKMDALFWLTPLDPTTDQVRREQNRLGENAAAAINANRIVRVVNLSSIGAQHDSGLGPISGLHDVEELLNQTGAYITHVRASSFYENYLMQAGGIAQAGCVFYALPPDMYLPQIATRDIGLWIADRLLGETWRERTIFELHGPERLTMAEAAAAIGRGLGRDLQHVEVSEEDERQGMLAVGLGANFAEAVVEMHAGFRAGLVQTPDPRATVVRTPTTFEEFAATVIRPAVESVLA